MCYVGIQIIIEYFGTEFFQFINNNKLCSYLMYLFI